ncbi:hypothetical protein N2W54_005938 [Lotmaria passim]
MEDRASASITAGAEGVAAPFAPILGECVLKLTHSTTYEPPFYLFPELLPQVPQGTPPLPVWDAVADAVDISASSWRMADASQLLAASTVATSNRARGGTSCSSPRPPQAMVTLTSMIAENRLLAAGLDAHALQQGSFSSASIIQQLATLQARMALTDEEGAAIMSNHFINLLAWQKLREINGDERNADLAHNSAPSSSSSTTSAPKSSAASALSRKRAHAAEGNDDSSAWLPSPDPWASEAELACGGSNGERFVAAGEENVEDRVDLLRTLAELYQRPWRTMVSQGQQTDCVVPPGTVNVTSPFANTTKLPGAMLDPAAELGWGVSTTAEEHNPLFFGSVRLSHNACFYSVLISARSSQVGAAPQRVPLRQLVTYIGREAGAQRAAAVAAAEWVPIHAGLKAFTSQPEVLSRLHFALVLRPVYNHKTAMLASGGVAGSDAEAPPSSSDGEEDEDGATAPGAFAVVHTKTPDHYTLWLVNYGRNGVRVAGRGWVLGEPRQLRAGDTLVLGGDVELRVEQHSTAAAACATAAVDRADSSIPSQVKQERAEDE